MLLLLATAALADPGVDAYCATPRALYAWNCATAQTIDGQTSWWHLLHDTNGCGGRLVDFAVAHRFERVYLFVGALQWHEAGFFSQGELPEADALADLTTRLRAAGVEPWALWYANDDPDDLTDASGVVDLVASVAAFDAAHPAGAFAGLHGDQEPNDPRVLDAYLRMNESGREAAVAAGLGWGASLKPAWLTLPVGDPFVAQALAGLTVGTIMDYTDDPERARSQAETFLGFADASAVPGEVALETGWGDPTPGVSFVDLVRSDPDGFYALVGDLDGALAVHASYAGIAIHDFAQYFADLHDGVEPYDYVGPIDAPCPPGTGDTGTPGDTTDEPADDTAAPPSVPTGTTPDPSTPAAASPSGGPGCGCGTSTSPGAGTSALALVLVLRRLRSTAARRVPRRRV